MALCSAEQFNRDHCCRGKSKPGCRIVHGPATKWELIIGAEKNVWCSNTHTTAKQKTCKCENLQRLSVNYSVRDELPRCINRQKCRISPPLRRILFTKHLLCTDGGSAFFLFVRISFNETISKFYTLRKCLLIACTWCHRGCRTSTLNVTTLCFKNGHPFCFCYNVVSRDQIVVFLAVW